MLPCDCCVASLLVAFLCLLCSGQQPLRDPGTVFQSGAGQGRIDLDIVNMDVAAVLKIISDAGGWTIIPSKKVTENAKVSLWCKGAGARQLLEKLCLVNGYVYKEEEEGNLIYLMTKDEYEQVFGGVSRMFVLNFQRAETIKPLVESSLTKAGKVGIDPWSNTIIVNDTAENLQKVESLIVAARSRIRAEAVPTGPRQSDRGGPDHRADLSEGRIDPGGCPDQRPRGVQLAGQPRKNRGVDCPARPGPDHEGVLDPVPTRNRIGPAVVRPAGHFQRTGRQWRSPHHRRDRRCAAAAGKLSRGTVRSTRSSSPKRTNQIIATGNAAEIEYIDGPDPGTGQPGHHHDDPSQAAQSRRGYASDFPSGQSGPRTSQPISKATA